MKFEIFNIFLLITILQSKSLRTSSPKLFSNERNAFYPHITKDHLKSFNKISQKIISQLRFKQTDSSNNIEFFNNILIKSASSNSTFPLFSASNAIHENYGYWCSNGSHSNDEIIYWQGDFSNIFGFSYLIIKWAYAPTFYSLQISTNNVDFKEVVPWRKCAFGETSRKWKESFYWWKWKDRSFLEMINLPEKLSAISIRILMKSPVFSFFGIYEVKVFDRKSVVLIKTTIDNEDYCLLKTKENAVVYDCLDSSSFAFNNDLFKITKDFKIVSPSDKKCLTLKNQKIFFSHCQSSNNQKWELTEKNNFLVLANNSNSNKCLKATTIPIILTLNELNISATSIMNDDQHKAINPFLENNPELCWVSSPGIQEVRYIVRFKEVPIEKIVIKWKYKPKEIRINFSFNEVFWKNVKNLGDFGDNEKVETIFKVDESITGFRIIFLESKELFNDQMVFGIDKIRIITKFKRVEMVDCERKEENQGIEWKIEDLNENFIYENHFQNLKSAHNSLFKKTDNLLKVNKDLSNFNDTLQVFFETSKNIQFKIDKTVNFYIGLNQKISKFKEKNLQNEEINYFNKRIISSMGSTRYKPGESCSAIKKMHIRKRSGFYWIHPPCSQTSIRVFCDFQSDYYQDYYFIQKNLNLKSIQEIEQICANYGLEPYDLTSKAQYDKITTFLMSIKALENDNEMIPIAFDKNSCFNKKCSRNYVSLSSRSSIDYFTWQSENLVSVFPILSEENKNDFLGFDKEKLVPFNLAYSKIKGLLCSTNSHNINEENKNLNDWIKIKCTTSVKYNQEFPMSFSPNANFKIKCPQNCMKFKDKSKVYGSDFYKDDSSICLAAIHNKKMDPEKGGFISIKILEGKRNYIGSRRNEIESLDWEQSLDRYFVIESYENKCPFDRFKLKNDDYLLKDSIKFVEFDSFSNINVDKEEEDVKSNKMQNLERIFQRQKIGLDYFIDITQETKILLENMWNILNKAENKNLFPKIQEDLLNKNTGFFLEVEKNIKKLLLLAKTKLIEKRKKHKLLSKEKNKFLQISDYIEDYSSKIEENWLLSQELKLNKNTHQWSYTLKNVLNHNTTLECTELRKSDLPSIFVLRNKKYYDFLLSFSVMSTNFGIVGSAFRYKDSFNYYVLEISRSIDPLQNFKRIRKIYNGVSSELIRLDDGGFMENIWYRISVKAQRENIEVIINEENNSHKKPVIFRIYDGDLVYGTLTLTTQNITSVYFDHFRVNALECRKVENFLNNAVVYQINTCSRFKELYKADFDFIWKSIDPFEINNGPSKWSYSYYIEKSKIIFQGSQIKGRKMNQEPAILELKIDKICNTGVIKTQILLKQIGYAGIAFRYKNNKEYYSFELHLSEENKFCRIRKTQNGIPTLLEENIENCSEFIKNDTWISIIIQMKNDKTKIFFIKNEILIQIFEIISDSTNENNKVALLSYGTMAGFTEFELMPSEDYDFSLNNQIHSQFEINKEKNSIFLNSCSQISTKEREKYCRKTFQEHHKFLLCKKEFCSSCCEMESFSIRSNKRKCEKSCKSIIMESKENIWNKCVDDQIDRSQSYKECESGFFNIRETNRCKIDLCSLCCIKGENVFNRENTEKCKLSCTTKYKDY